MGPLLHAESCASHGVDRRISSAHLDMCCALSAEEEEQQFAGRPGVEQVAELCPLDGVEELGHIAGV